MKKICFLLIDLQEKLVPTMNNSKDLVKNCSTLVKASKILGIPLVVTEQDKLGKTVVDVKDTIVKKSFSCFDNKEFLEKIKPYKEIIVFGIESHICVWQTVFDSIGMHKKVTVVLDGISSRKKTDYKAAIFKMDGYGINFTTTEMILFEIMKSSKHPKFKEIQSLIK